MTGHPPGPDTAVTGLPRLTVGQICVLSAAAVPMVATGAAGAIGTYTNIVAEFGRAETALGIVAAGEGLALVLALVMVGLTMLGQPSPAPVRIGLWAVPIAASVVGVSLADTLTEAVIYGMSPMGMCVSAEGLGLLARRIVTYRTGVDMEAQRRNAATMQRLAYHRARAMNHPSDRVRWWSERISWRLARKVGVGDARLGEHLVCVQRGRLSQGADTALADMLGVTGLPVLETGQDTGADSQDADEDTGRDTGTDSQDTGQDTAVPPVPPSPDTAPAAAPVLPLFHPATARTDQQPTDRASLVLTASADRQDTAPQDTVSRPARTPSRPGSPSVRDTIRDAIKTGVDPEDRDTLRARVHAVHGDVKDDNFRRSRSRAVQDLRAGEGFYP